MEYYMRLPRSKKEFCLFMLVISVISVNIIAPTITFLEIGFSWEHYLGVLKILPLVWLCVIALVILTYKPAEKLTNVLIKKEDSFKAHMLANIMSTVFMMSIILTIVATWIGEWHFGVEAFEMFFYRWPRNFAISFAVEFLIAQPIARCFMQKYHEIKDKKTNFNNNQTTNV